MAFEPDYRNIVAAARNERPGRLPIYEHLVNDGFIAAVLGEPIGAAAAGDAADVRRYVERLCEFYRRMGYDMVSYEVCISSVLPGAGALLGEHAGPIQTRADFESYPWDEVPVRYWELASPRFELLAELLPDGMKAVGGVGNGVLEIVQDLVGYEQLCYMQADAPELFADLCSRAGELVCETWREFLGRHADAYCVARIGDDMGFKTGTLLAPRTLVAHVVPAYRRVIALIHQAGLPFLLHSCGRVFDVMDALIAAGIDAKHSNEDVIAPFDEWIARYGRRIGLFGGIDVDVLCREQPEAIYERTLELGARWRDAQAGFALGSGNSIPDFVPVEGYMAMIRAANDLRQAEG